MGSPPRLRAEPGAALSARGWGTASPRPATLPSFPGGKQLACSLRPLGYGWRRVLGNLTPFSARILAFTLSPGVSGSLQAEPSPGAVPPWETPASLGGHHLPGSFPVPGSVPPPPPLPSFKLGLSLPDMSTLMPLLPFPAASLSFPFLPEEPLSRHWGT